MVEVVLIAEPGRPSGAQLAAAEALVSSAFGSRFRSHDWLHAVDGIHVVRTDDHESLAVPCRHRGQEPCNMTTRSLTPATSKRSRPRADQQGRAWALWVMDHAETTIGARHQLGTPPVPVPTDRRNKAQRSLAYSVCVRAQRTRGRFRRRAGTALSVSIKASSRLGGQKARGAAALWWLSIRCLRASCSRPLIPLTDGFYGWPLLAPFRASTNMWRLRSPRRGNSRPRA